MSRPRRKPCRWLGYIGSPVEPRELLYDSERSLIEQRQRHAPNMKVEKGRAEQLTFTARPPS